jgi:hypothetical protein
VKVFSQLHDEQQPPFEPAASATCTALCSAYEFHIRRTNCTMADFTDHLKPAHDGTAALKAERDGSAIGVSQLARHLLGRDGFLERQEKVLKVLSKEKVFSKDQQLNLSRPERYHLGLARAKAIQRLIRREGWDQHDAQMAEYLNDEMSPYFLHMSMFGELTNGPVEDVMHVCVTWALKLTMSPCSDNGTRAGF